MSFATALAEPRARSGVYVLATSMPSASKTRKPSECHGNARCPFDVSVISDVLLQPLHTVVYVHLRHADIRGIRHPLCVLVGLVQNVQGLPKKPSKVITHTAGSMRTGNARVST